MQYREKIYLVKKKTIDDGVIEYESPKEIVLRPFFISVMPVDSSKGSYSTQEYGTQITYDWVSVAYKSKFRGMFSEGDLLYLDGAKPLNNNGNYEDANAIIANVLDNNYTYKILIKSRVMKEEY